MKRRRKLLLTLILLAVAVMAGMFFLWPRGPREPVYQGKTLTQWINEARDGDYHRTRLLARIALDATGTNALPFLLHEFTRPVSRWRERFNTWARGHPSIKLRLRDDRQRLATAEIGLRILGTNVAPAIPALVRHLGDPDRSQATAYILRDAGDSSLPHLVAALDSPAALAVSNALSVLQVFACRAGPGREAFAAALHHPRAEVRADAAKSWGVSTANPAEVVPGLLKLTHDPSPLVARASRNQLELLSQTAPEPVRAAARAALLPLHTNAPPPRGN